MKSKTIRNYCSNEKRRDYQFNIGKRTIDRNYLEILKEYPGQLTKLIENEINNYNNLLENKLINQ